MNIIDEVNRYKEEAESLIADFCSKNNEDFLTIKKEIEGEVSKETFFTNALSYEKQFYLKTKELLS